MCINIVHSDFPTVMMSCVDMHSQSRVQYSREVKTLKYRRKTEEQKQH